MSSKGISMLPKTRDFRLILWYSAVFILCMVGLLAGFYLYLARHLGQRDRLDLAQKDAELASLYQGGGVHSIHPNTHAFRSYLIRLAAPGRAPILLSEAEDWEDVEAEDLDACFRNPGESWFQARDNDRDPGSSDGEGYEFYSRKLPDGWFLQVGTSMERREDLLRNYRHVFEIAVIPMVLLGMLGGSFLAFNHILNPVHRLTGTLQTILKGDLSARVPEGPAQDELGRLTRLFNQMLNRIEALVRGMRQSTDNVAHDLRTPLTRLKMVAETALQEKPSVADYREALADCVEEADRILFMLNALMDISEAESGVMKLNLGAIALPALLEETVELYQHVADEKGVQLRWRAAPETRARADRDRLRQVLANLVDNAVKYTPPGGLVELDAKAVGGSAVITVRDNGMGIGAEDMPHIWDRLYRGDQSRSQKGMGLGLSLVKAVVDAHHGKVSVESAPGQGSTFTLELPGANPTNL